MAAAPFVQLSLLALAARRRRDRRDHDDQRHHDQTDEPEHHQRHHLHGPKLTDPRTFKPGHDPRASPTAARPPGPPPPPLPLPLPLGKIAVSCPNLCSDHTFRHEAAIISRLQPPETGEDRGFVSRSTPLT
ncbi:hypothetical protein CS0771_70970 [Catellatospora sp. IY07-71]|nr:hypothetical protein CS0771_70970 [Catellatospora sp. IY07-71]